MGLSASQSRLLTLTSRMSDLEYRAQSISNSKIRLSQNTASISQAYSDALDTKKFQYLNSNTNTCCDLTYNALTGPSEALGCQYCVTDSNDNVMVTSSQADAYKSSPDLEGFLETEGVTSRTYPGYANRAAYLADLSKAQATYAQAKNDLDDFAPGTVRGYNTNSGSWSYSDTVTNVKTQTEDNSAVWGDPHYTVNGRQVDHKGVIGATYDSFEGDNLKVYSTYGSPNNGYCVIVSSKITTGDSTITYNSNGSATFTKNGKTSNLATSTGASLNDGSGSNYSYDGSTLVVRSADGSGTVSLNGVNINVNGQFADLGGIMGTAVKNGTALSVEDCDAAMVDSNNADGITVNGNDVNSKTYDWSADTHTTTAYNSAANPDKIEFLDANGKVITDPNQIAASTAKWTTLYAAFNKASSVLAALKELPGAATDGPNVADKNYYTNLYARMQQGYKQLGDESVTTNPNWIEDQITNGNLSMEKCVAGVWKDTTWQETSGIVQQSDDNAAAKAEAVYESANAQVQSKDNRFDLELKQIDTEHSAIQTEVDSVKKVIDKNIERTFKIFDA